jgi:hypothetical protein
MICVTIAVLLLLLLLVLLLLLLLLIGAYLNGNFAHSATLSKMPVIKGLFRLINMP